VTRSLGWLWLALLLVWPRLALARPPARALKALNVAALASSPERLYVGGFDEGLFVIERDSKVHRFDDAALGPHINALAWSEATKSLWVGTARGLVRCDVTARATCRRLGGSSPVHALLLRSDGSLVAGGDAGLYFVAGEATRVFGKKQSAPFRAVWSLAEAEGKLFVGTTNGLFWGAAAAFAPGGARLERAALVLGNLPDDWVTALLAQDGRLLVGTYNAGAVSFAIGASGLAVDGADPSLGYVNPAGLVALDASGLAVATMDGLRIGRLGETRLLETSTPDITALAPAIGGGYWVGSRRGLEWLASLGP
jgi:ligand-binding sensor domain-containing protein